MDSVNGSPDGVAANPMAAQIVDALSRLMSDVKAGRTTSVAFVAVGPQGQIQAACAGFQRGELYLGGGMIQRQLMEEFVQPQAQRPSILPARGFVPRNPN